MADTTPVPEASGSESTAPARPRRRRGAVESLGSVVLGFESIIVFLAGLVMYGLDVLPGSIEPWWGIVAGAVLAVLMIFVAGLLRHRWAVAVGWALQVVLGLGAFFVPAILIVFLIFGGLWAYATIKGAQLDARNATLAARTPDTAASNGD